MTVPVVEEAVDERARVVETLPGAPRLVEVSSERCDVVARDLRECENGIFDIAEVLVERRGRRPDEPRDVDDAEIANAVIVEQLLGGFEEASARLDAAPSQGAPVNGHHVAHRRRG